MRFRRSIRHAAATFAAALCVSVGAGSALGGEVRFGLYQHDTGIVGTHKEAGIDYVGEVLSEPLDFLSLIGSPRFMFGGALNSAGKTDQVYAGLTKEWDFVHSVFARQDAFFLEGTIGGDWNDGKRDVLGTPAQASWKSHGSHYLFRIGTDFGYRFNRKWTMAASFFHISNAGLADRNEGMNEIGLRVGMEF